MRTPVIKHIVITAAAPFRGRRSQSSEGLGGLETGFVRLAEIADYVFRSDVAECLTFQDQTLDQLLTADRHRKAAGIALNCLASLHLPASVGRFARGDAPCLARPEWAPFKAAFPAGGKAFTLLIGHGGRGDIVHAAQKAARDGTGDLSKHLAMAGAPDPDLVIVAGGKPVLPDLMLFQIAYSEFVFFPGPWPSFSVSDLKAAAAEFAGRERRYGKV